MPYKDKKKQLEAQRRHYRKKSAYYKAKAKGRKQELRGWFRELKAKLRCIECGEDHVACLEFHHRDPREKENCLYEMISAGKGQKTILREIEKCDPVCANCHRKIHYRSRAVR